jgi:U2-associated protein SR140
VRPSICVHPPTADHAPGHACRERELRRSTGFDVAEEDVPRSGGSYDNGDPTTTNLYVGNLAPSVDEHTLMVLFGKYGPVASVKIMWPRELEERSRGHMPHTGFVAFMARQAAEDALQHLQGHLLHGAFL